MPSSPLLNVSCATACQCSTFSVRSHVGATKLAIRPDGKCKHLLITCHTQLISADTSRTVHPWVFKTTWWIDSVYIYEEYLGHFVLNTDFMTFIFKSNISTGTLVLSTFQHTIFLTAFLFFSPLPLLVKCSVMTRYDWLSVGNQIKACNSM